MSLWISLLNDLSVTLFGVVLSAAFCGLSVRANLKPFLLSMVFFGVLQGLVYYWWDAEVLRSVYPVIIHVPLVLIFTAMTRQPLWSAIAVLSAYLCCQLRRWIALLLVAVLSGGAVMQDGIELLLTIPLLPFLLRFAAPAIRGLADRPAKVQLYFGVIPAVYYAFDYLTVVYTDLLISGHQVVVEFMPFVCCGAYLVFLLFYSAEERKRGQLRQVQQSLNLQLTQSVREIHALRESQALASQYRHDLRHHLQYVSACIENGQTQQAKAYISSICERIEAQKVRRYCENETVNLILSSFAGRAEREGIGMDVQGSLPNAMELEDSDLCVILSNALENAIHACLPLAADGTPCTIEVRFYRREHRVFLQVSNPFRGEVRFQDGVPVTDVPGHGLGVQSICAIVRRRGGVYAFLVEDGRFILRLSL